MSKAISAEAAVKEEKIKTAEQLTMVELEHVADGKGDAVNFASDMEKAKFFGKEGDEPNLCENIEKKW